MSDTINNMENKNLPAFPVPENVLVHNKVAWDGLSKREYFAAKSLQGLLSDPEFRPLLTDEDMAEDKEGRYKKSDNGYWCEYPNGGGTHKIITTFEQRVARVAVNYADGLLTELEK